MTRILHFTLTPVQTFIGQSRRTRDLWSSSFLLSWLSGVAMAEAIHLGARIAFPAVQDADGRATDPLLHAIQCQRAGKPVEGEHPFIGTLPNRFKAIVPDGFDPEACAQALRGKWMRLCGAVHERFLPIAELRRKELAFVPKKKLRNPNAQHKTLTETLWDRQVEHHWDIQWVMGEAGAADGPPSDDGRWLDLRKNWRQHAQPDEQEPGDPCTLMPGWVELSGHIRAKHRQAQDDFWKLVRDHVPRGNPGRDDDPRNPGAGRLNLREDERLCAIAFVKRLWPKLPKEDIQEVFGWVPDRTTRSGGNWPSTAYMAALPWLRQAYRDDPAACDAYAAQLDAVRMPGLKPGEGLFSEKMNQIAGIADKEYFCTLDGQLFFRDGVIAACKEQEPLLDPAKQGALLKTLAKLQERGQPSPFYAVLRMDGDDVGGLLGRGADKVSAALSAFANRVRDTVDQSPHGGATLYAGGDDVLALLTVDQALPCALALRHAYIEAMRGQGLPGTISAAIVFAHYHLPLSFVMAESTRLLDDVAKKRNGRDSVAVVVHKPGGPHLEWVAQWDQAEDATEPDTAPVATLLELARHFEATRDRAAAGSMPALSSGFLYRIRERWGDLTTPTQDGKAPRRLPAFEPDYVRKLWQTDLLANRDLGDITPQTRAQAGRLARQLFAISRDQQHQPAADATPPARTLSEDGALLVRFLATGGARR